MKKFLCAFLTLLLVLSIVPLSVSAADVIVFVKDAGDDAKAGTSADTALKTLEKAYDKVKAGGTIVVCGPTTLTANWGKSFGGVPEDGFNTPANTGKITLTCKYNNVDYGATAGAVVYMGCFWYFNGDTVFKDFNLKIMKTSMLLCCNNSNVTFDTGITVTKDDAATNFAGITLGRNDVDPTTKNATLIVNSGTYQMLRGGNRNAGGPIEGDLNITLNGGEFLGACSLGGASEQKGNINITINSGVKFGEAATWTLLSTGSLTGNIKMTINGGTFLGPKFNFMPANGKGITGDLTLKINGGDFTAVTETLMTGATGKITFDVGDWKDKNAAFVTLFTDAAKLASTSVNVITTPSPVTTAATTKAPTTTAAAGAVTTAKPAASSAQTADTSIYWGAVAFLMLAAAYVFTKKLIAQK